MQDLHMKHFFYPNACNVCHAYGKDVVLLRCSNCKMTVYCSPEHQRTHWPLHKEICQVVTEMLRTNIRLYEPQGIGGPAGWLVTRVTFTLLVQRIMNRKLMDHEAEMLLSPRSCEFCREMDPTKLTNCNECPFASFCNLHPKDGNHATRCHLSRLSFEALHLNYSPDNYFVCENYGLGFPNDMREAIMLYESTYRFDKLFKDKKFWALILSEQISSIYTFMFTMQKWWLPLSETMTVHVVGSNLVEIVTSYYWRRVLHHVDELDELIIVFIGPEINEDNKKLAAYHHYEVDDRHLRIQFVGDYYTHYAASPSFTEPDCVIGFNLGIVSSLLKTDTWAPTINVLAELECPFAFTSVSQLEANIDRDRINAILGREVEPSWLGVNPFSSYKPNRNVATDHFFYNNSYLNIYDNLA